LTWAQKLVAGPKVAQYDACAPIEITQYSARENRKSDESESFSLHFSILGDIVLAKEREEKKESGRKEGITTSNWNFSARVSTSKMSRS